jgi:hypothetical protein
MLRLRWRPKAIPQNAGDGVLDLGTVRTMKMTRILAFLCVAADCPLASKGGMRVDPKARLDGR